MYVCVNKRKAGLNFVETHGLIQNAWLGTKDGVNFSLEMARFGEF